MARIAEHMDRHWWSAAVQEAGTDALIALLPRHLFAACKSSSTGAALANVLRGTYGKLSGAHVAVGVLRVAVKAARTPKHRSGGPPHGERLAGWKHRPSETFDPAHSDSDDDDNMYLLRQRLIGHTRQVTPQAPAVASCRPRHVTVAAAVAAAGVGRAAQGFAARH